MLAGGAGRGGLFQSLIGATGVCQIGLSCGDIRAGLIDFLWPGAVFEALDRMTLRLTPGLGLRHQSAEPFGFKGCNHLAFCYLVSFLYLDGCDSLVAVERQVDLTQVYIPVKNEFAL